MNGKGYVSPDMRVRVQKAAQSLRYVPRHAARSLPSRSTGNVGFVVREDHFQRTESFYTRIYLGTEFHADKQRLYVLLTTIPRSYASGKNTPRFLKEQNVDGILIAGKVDDAFIADAQASGVPVVLVDFEHDGLPAALIDNWGGARSAARHLLERGHERITFLGADMRHPSLSARREGFQQACAEAGLPADRLRFIVADDGEPDYQTGARLCKRLFDDGDRPTAVFCINDAMALSVLDYAAHLGLGVPEDVAVVGFDDVPAAERSQPALTTIRVPNELLGELAMRYLIDLVHDTPSIETPYVRGPHSIRVPTELIIRNTT
jgi:LacI family transcriptional regulator